MLEVTVTSRNGQRVQWSQRVCKLGLIHFLVILCVSAGPLLL